MLSAQAYSFRQNSRLAISLSWIGGYTNIVALLCAGHVVSHITGNTTFLGKFVVEQRWYEASFFAVMLACFLLGAIASACMTEWARRQSIRSKYIFPMAVEMVLLSALSLLVSRYHRVDPDGSLSFAICGVAAAAMGLQNATITQISGAVVRTTHLTGVLTDIGLEGVKLLLWYRDQLRGRWARRAGRVMLVSQRHPTFLRVLLLASIFGSFVFGVLAGSLAFSRYPDLALMLPVAFLLWIIFVDWYWPIVEVRELDLLNDPELVAQGIVKAMLPPNVGIYRFAGGAGHAGRRAPHFEAWADRLPRHWSVVILAISRHTRFDAPAVRGLAAATERLARNHRSLIISGITPAQFRALSALNADQFFDTRNLCADIEFAIVRAMAILQEDEAAGQAGPLRNGASTASGRST